MTQEFRRAPQASLKSRSGVRGPGKSPILIIVSAIPVTISGRLGFDTRFHEISQVPPVPFR